MDLSDLEKTYEVKISYSNGILTVKSVRPRMEIKKPTEGDEKAVRAEAKKLIKRLPRNP
jgi:hypothetical protein